MTQFILDIFHEIKARDFTKVEFIEVGLQNRDIKTSDIKADDTRTLAELVFQLHKFMLRVGFIILGPIPVNADQRNS